VKANEAKWRFAPARGRTTVTLDTQDRTLSADFEEYFRGADGSPQIEMMFARRASDFLRAAAQETLLLLLCLLSERERSVTDLENILGLRQPTVSQHLARLRLALCPPRIRTYRRQHRPILHFRLILAAATICLVQGRIARN
jgi:predicted transcriptional regulator